MNLLQKDRIVTLLDSFNNGVAERKEILPLVILIPTLIGGLWQVLELMVIDPAFIRFFSISQLIPDGLLILAIIMFLAVSFFISNIGFKYSQITSTEELGESAPFQLVRGLILTMSSMLMFGCFLYTLDVHVQGTSNLRFLEILLLIFMFIMLSKYFLRGLFLFLFGCFVYYFKKNKENIVVEIENFIDSKGRVYSLTVKGLQLLTLLLVPILIAVMIVSFVTLRNKLVFPERVENINYVFQKVKQQYGTQQKSKILYFNDRYVFVELIEENKDVKDGKIPTKIVVYKNEDILFK